MALDQAQIDVLEEHLPYELDMLEGSLGAWAGSDRETRGQWVARMAPIEAFWVHARILWEFFCKSTTTAASADHFTTTRLTYDIPDIGDIQTQIVHLNYGRPRGDNKAKLDIWRARNFVGEVNSAVDRFEAALSEESRRHWKKRVRLAIAVPGNSLSSSSTHTAILSDDVPTGFGHDTGTNRYIGGPTGPAPPRK
ncbi:hypothetical protein [Pseudolabrys sp. Root1462]|uniref:hypothetical protein n=1 Tax=Pseudolabrys sp. Root1462 TaxID=1736466 RepID=UPI0012E34D3A|nr:hypothetical protein [Pseudolabrys sp. Root1462]